MTSILPEIHKADSYRESNSPKCMGGYNIISKDMNTSGAAIDTLYLMVATCKDARLNFIGKSHFKPINYMHALDILWTNSFLACVWSV